MVMFHGCWQSTRHGFPQIFAIEIVRENFDVGRDAARGSSRSLPIKETIMNREHDISVLDGLTTTTLDSMKGYEDAAKAAKNTQFASLFADFRQRASRACRVRPLQPADHAGDRRPPVTPPAVKAHQQMKG